VARVRVAGSKKNLHHARAVWCVFGVVVRGCIFFSPPLPPMRRGLCGALSFFPFFLLEKFMKKEVIKIKFHF
jgi:hypothetical protein